MKKNIAFIVCFMCIFSAFSQNSSFLDEKVFSELKTKGVIEEISIDKKSIEYSLLPKSEYSQVILNNWQNEKLPRLVSEKLFYVEKTSETQSIEEVSKIVREISTMKGTQYYSNSHKKWETLYHEAYLIDSKENKNQIPDDIEGSADGKTLYCYLKDNSFGNCYYQIDYKQNENQILVSFDNFEPFKLGGITIAKIHNVKIDLIVIEEKDYFIVYLTVKAIYPKISFLEGKVIKSFNARIDSIYDWFIKGLNKIN